MPLLRFQDASATYEGADDPRPLRFDLTAADGGKVGEFYAGLFGWTIGPGAGDYHGWMTDSGRPWAGITPAGAVPAGQWVPYVVVDDLDAAAEQAVALGGSVVQEKTASASPQPPTPTPIPTARRQGHR